MQKVKETVQSAMDRDGNGRVSSKEWGKGLRANAALLGEHFGHATAASAGDHEVCARRSVHSDIQQVRDRAGGASDDVIISVAELLSFVSFSAARGPDWRGMLLLYAGDNCNVVQWVKRHTAGN